MYIKNHCKPSSYGIFKEVRIIHPYVTETIFGLVCFVYFLFYRSISTEVQAGLSRFKTAETRLNFGRNKYMFLDEYEQASKKPGLRTEFVKNISPTQSLNQIVSNTMEMHRQLVFVHRSRCKCPSPEKFLLILGHVQNPKKNPNPMLKSLAALHEMARAHTKKRLVLAAAHDENALEAVVNAAQKGIVEGILVGDQSKIESIAYKQQFALTDFKIIDEPDVDKAATIAVKMVREKQADILMKGNLPTSSLLRAVLNKEWGLRTGELISHLALFELESYHKIIGLTDAAMNIAPDLKGKISLVKNSVNYLRKLGISQPKVAMLSAVETVNPDMKSSLEASILAKMADRGQIRNCIIDGPLAFDNAVSGKSAEHKGIHSPVAGDADLLVADDIDAANALYKAFIYFAGAQCAAVILGAAAPIVLTSRADSDETKLNSIALAAAVN